MEGSRVKLVDESGEAVAAEHLTAQQLPLDTSCGAELMLDPAGRRHPIVVCFDQPLHRSAPPAGRVTDGEAPATLAVAGTAAVSGTAAPSTCVAPAHRSGLARHARGTFKMPRMAAKPPLPPLPVPEPVVAAAAAVAPPRCTWLQQQLQQEPEEQQQRLEAEPSWCQAGQRAAKQPAEQGAGPAAQRSADDVLRLLMGANQSSPQAAAAAVGPETYPAPASGAVEGQPGLDEDGCGFRSAPFLRGVKRQRTGAAQPGANAPVLLPPGPRWVEFEEGTSRDGLDPFGGDSGQSLLLERSAKGPAAAAGASAGVRLRWQQQPQQSQRQQQQQCNQEQQQGAASGNREQQQGAAPGNREQQQGGASCARPSADLRTGARPPLAGSLHRVPARGGVAPQAARGGVAPQAARGGVAPQAARRPQKPADSGPNEPVSGANRLCWPSAAACVRPQRRVAVPDTFASSQEYSQVSDSMVLLTPPG